MVQDTSGLIKLAKEGFVQRITHPVLYVTVFFLIVSVSFVGASNVEETTPAPYDNPEVTSINLEPYHATLTPYESTDEAFEGKVLSSRTISLNGNWKFKMVVGKENVIPDYMKPDFKVSDWSELPVPSNWQRHGFGLAIYSNSTLDKEPDEVGLYRRTFTVPESWIKNRTILHFAGVKTAYHVYINGKEVGYNEGAFLAGEFDITDYLNAGGNTIAVTVYRTADVSDIENFDTWRLSGIFRDVKLFNRPLTYIEDFEVQAPLINNYQDGQWNVRVKVRNKSDAEASGLKLVASLRDDRTGEVMYSKTLDVPVVAGKDLVEVETGNVFENILPWSDEKPNLYTTVLELRDSNDLLEAVSAKTGFRTIEVKGKSLLINGKRLIFRGVNRQEWNPDVARALTPSYMRKELEMMKRYNINSIRTSHYPNDPFFYQLADELGILVMDEAANETHWKNDRALRKGWLNPHMVRMIGMVERDKNHPSVVMWSAGNEFHSGVNTDSMAIYCAERDPSRPIFYEGEKPGKFDNGEEFEKYKREIFNTAYQFAKPNTLSWYVTCEVGPIVIKEYMHTRGNTLSRFYEVFEQIRDPEHYALSGGFIWDWKDQGWRVRAGDVASPLDNGETIGEVYKAHDGSDGVTDSDLNITPKLLEVSKVYQQLEVEAGEAGKGTFRITNFYNFTPLSDFDITYYVEHNGKRIHRGSITDVEAAPGESAEFSVDLDGLSLESGEYWITFEFFLKESVSGIPVTHALAFAQLPLNNPEPVNVIKGSIQPVKVVDGGDHFILQSDRARFEISGESGKIIAWRLDGKELLQDENGFEPTIWRAPIAPDVVKWGGNDKRYYLPWKAAGLEDAELITKSVKLNEEGTGLDVELSLQTNDHSIAIFKHRYTLLEDGSMVVGTCFLPEEAVSSLKVIPRLGITCELTSEFNQAVWFGKGPLENYNNRDRGARIGQYAMSAEEMYTDYIEPQSSGNRSLIRWLKIADKSGLGFKASLIPGAELKKHTELLPAVNSIADLAVGDWFEFTAIPYSDDELAPASLFSQLPESSGVTLHLDLEQTGVSQKPFPPRWSEDEVKPVKKAFAFVLKPLPDAY